MPYQEHGTGFSLAFSDPFSEWSFSLANVLLGITDLFITFLFPVVGSSPAISENDAACGRLLHLAVMQAPEMAKAWSTLASWCYRWGRKAVDIAR